MDFFYINTRWNTNFFIEFCWYIVQSWLSTVTSLLKNDKFRSIFVYKSLHWMTTVTYCTKFLCIVLRKRIYIFSSCFYFHNKIFGIKLQNINFNIHCCMVNTIMVQQGLQKSANLPWVYVSPGNTKGRNMNTSRHGYQADNCTFKTNDKTFCFTMYFRELTISAGGCAFLVLSGEFKP